MHPLDYQIDNTLLLPRSLHRDVDSILMCGNFSNAAIQKNPRCVKACLLWCTSNSPTLVPQ